MPPTIHATAVARDGAAILLVGPPGSGKSDLALRLLDRGWQLVADDRVIATPEAGRLMLSAPATLAGLLEVRGVGILPVEAAGRTPARLLVDLAEAPERLPEPETREIAGVALPLLRLNAFEGSAPIKIERALAQALAAG
jgi:serine kinase of HPr protein (carbohydrate metabolism regulator)